MNRQPPRGYFLTNQMNLFMILAAGLLMPREGFGDKYYADLQADLPGWIPLLPDAAPPPWVERVVAEARHLKPVMLEIDLAGLQGPAKIRESLGAWKDIPLPEAIPETAEILLIPGPIPTSLIRRVIFSSAADKKDFLLHAETDYRNVPASWFTTTTAKKWFRGKRSGPLPTSPGPVPGNFAGNRSQAVGGALGLLFHLANRFDWIAALFQWAVGHQPEGPAALDPLFRSLPAWMAGEPRPARETLPETLFWSLIDDLVDARDQGLHRDRVLQNLKSAPVPVDGPNREKVQARLQQLVEDLESLRGLSAEPLSTLLQRHTGPFSRALLLFFIIESPRELLDYHQPDLSAADYAAAAILGAAAQGWIDLGVDLRYGRPLADAVADRMALCNHRSAGTGLTLTRPAAVPSPLRALLTAPPDARKTPRQTEAARVALARGQKWGGIETTIALPQGTYRLEVEKSSVRIVLDGEIRNVHARVDPDVFWRRFEALPLPLEERIEQLVRRVTG